jgi:hypothetical protein
MIKKSGSHYCNICNKSYSSSNSLWNHNKKFHTLKNDICTHNVTNLYSFCSPSVVLNSEKKNYNCYYCNKVLSSRQNKWRHEKVCITKNNNQEIIEKQNQEIIKLKEKLNNKLFISNTNNGTINNTNNINNNTNNIIINQIGKETIKSLPIKDILKIVRDGSNGPITCIKKLNFNKNIPENHSFCTTTLEGKHFTRINPKTQKPEKINKMEFIDEILDSSLKFINNISFLIEFDDAFKNKIPIEDQEKIKEIVINQNKFHEVRNKKIFFNNINDMSYNFKELILSTWKLIQNNKDETESESEEKIFDYNSSDNEL